MADPPDIAFARAFAVVRGTGEEITRVAAGVLFPDGQAIVRRTGEHGVTTVPHPDGMPSVIAPPRRGPALPGRRSMARPLPPTATPGTS
ncbi:hypothetical protein [Actinacidiphila glaucinigra]|uniref:hypothetical protein n=1 Tax=Actinacidiphila glaucinigra TaxID=235986 RepID=UPI003719E659